MSPKNTIKAVADKPQKDYPRLPILARASIGSEGKDFQHGIGVLATGDPATNQPRISIGNVWFPQDEATGDRHPAFMRSTSVLTLEDAERFGEDLAKAIKQAKKGDFIVTQKPKKETAKASTPAVSDAAVADQVRQTVIATFVKMGMTEAQAQAAYAKSQENEPVVEEI
jgi:hypothetical protein